jgi:AraC family transcriptional regulator, regulatory protein of adaptative response / methylated-DNA-[protein]-cysteine methyltransferase
MDIATIYAAEGNAPTMKTPPPPSVFPGKAWQQVLARDRNADGMFVYAVKSTGIYCKPSCASRRPDRKNVKFYPGAAAAEAAGFRACLRCEPNLAQPKDDPQAGAIAAATKLLQKRGGGYASLDELAKAAGMGKFAVQRGFKRILGVTPGEYARAQRHERFREELGAGEEDATVTDAIYTAGFGSSSRVYEGADGMLGMSPSAMKRGGTGETIRYTITDSPLGRMLVGATDKGLCRVQFNDDDAEAEKDLHDYFPQATLVRDDAGLGEEVRSVLQHIRESASASGLPFHVRATAFQQRVWKALTEIPRGETRTYSQIAESIGSPKAVRAVGAACGANPIAVVVPCHRAVGASGSLTGFRWGLKRKKQLLEMEQKG